MFSHEKRIENLGDSLKDLEKKEEEKKQDLFIQDLVLMRSKRE